MHSPQTPDGAMIIRTPLLVDDRGISRGDFALSMLPGSRVPSVATVGDFASAVQQWPGAVVKHADAVSPLLVNAHTHLDLSTYPALRSSFPDFVMALMRHRRAFPQARNVSAAMTGLQQLIEQRLCAVGDIVARDTVLVAELRDSPLAGVAYREVVCTQLDAAPATLARLRQQLPGWRALQRRDGPVVGLCPQSPYLVCKPVLQALARWSIAEGLPLQIHVAESPSELEFFQTGAGAMARMLASSGFTLPPTPATLGFVADRAMTPIRYLAEIGFLDAAPTLVHCVHVSDEDVRIIAEYGCPVVSCPRSNANLMCGAFAWQKFVRAGVSVALATDSVASAHSLDLRAEMAKAFEVYGPEFNLGIALEWLTAGGNRALRRPAQSVGPGCRLDALTLVNLRAEPS